MYENLEAERARYADAEARGDLSGSAVWAGEAVDLVNGIMPAATIVEQTIGYVIKMLSAGSKYNFVGASRGSIGN